MCDELNWHHKTNAISERASTFERSATAEQCAALKDKLELLACDDFSATYTMQQPMPGQFALKGQLSVKGAQACVVSLDPVAFSITEDVDVAFVPKGAEAVLDPDIEHEALSLDDVETYCGDTIDVGIVFFDHLSAALDPYPRKDGVELSVANDATDDGETTHPFAALKALKDKN